MKILVSVHVVWWNASAYYAVTSAQALARRGHDVTVLAHRSTPAYRKAESCGLRVVGTINLLRSDPVTFLENLIALGRLMHAQKFDVLNPHRPEDHFHLSLSRIRVSSPAKVIRSVSDVRAPHANVVNRMLHTKWTHGFIYCARACQERYHSVFGLDHLPEKVIYSALDVDEFTKDGWSKDSRFLKLPSPRIGIIARLSPNKGHRTLIEAAAIVRREIASASFLVVGKEEEVSISELQDYARRQGVEDAFTFAGLLDDPRPAIAACDLGVVASLDSEVISRAAQEFFALGIPVVASSVNVLPEMIDDGVNGFLVPPGNSAELAERIIRLIRSESLRKKMGQEAAAQARNRHNLNVFGLETEQFIDDVLKGETPK